MNYLNLFEESVHKNYDKIALVDQDGTRKFTYDELDELSGRVATRLTQEGVCAGDSVMIHMGRKSEYFVDYLGILKMGGVFVPVIEEYPTDRIEYIEKDSQAKKVIRVGNLMSQHSDGEFQINFIANGFMRTLRGYAVIGKFPVSAMD